MSDTLRARDAFMTRDLYSVCCDYLQTNRTYNARSDLMVEVLQSLQSLHDCDEICVFGMVLLRCSYGRFWSYKGNRLK